MSYADVAPLAVLIPIGAAALAPLVCRLSRHAGLIMSIGALVASTALLGVCAPRVFGGHVIVSYLGGWTPIRGHALGIALATDPFGLVVALIAAGIGALALLATLSGMRELGRAELGAYSCLGLLLVAGVIGGALAADLFNLFVWFEVAALTSYALTGFFLERPHAVEAAFKIVVLTTLAGFLVFIGVALLYQKTGAVNVGQLALGPGAGHGAAGHGAAAGSTSGHGLSGVAPAVALALMVAGFGTKAGLAPFHGWLPDAHTAAPGPVSALFSGVMVNFGVVAIARVVFDVYAASAPPGTASGAAHAVATPGAASGAAHASTAAGAHAGLPILGVLMTLGAVSALFGSAYAVFQQDLKRLLAYDTISQLGLVVIGLACGSDAGFAGATYHVMSHALFKALLFLIAGAIVHTTGATDLAECGGMFQRHRTLVVLFCVGALAIAGIPPLNGYVSLGLLHDALLTGHEWLPLAIMLITQVLTVAAMARVIVAFFRPMREPYARDERLRPGMFTALAVLAAGCLATGFAARPLLDRVVGPAASGLTHPNAYARAVLSGGTGGGTGGGLGGGLGGGGVLPAPEPIAFSYLKPGELAATLGCLVVGVAVAWLVRDRTSGAARVLERVQTGSVNDYAAYLAVGAVAVAAVLGFAAWS